MEKKIKEINHVVDDLIDQKMQLKFTSELCTCFHCSASNPIDNNYCGNCGEKIKLI